MRVNSIFSRNEIASATKSKMFANHNIFTLEGGGFFKPPTLLVSIS